MDVAERAFFPSGLRYCMMAPVVWHKNHYVKVGSILVVSLPQTNWHQHLINRWLITSGLAKEAQISPNFHLRVQNKLSTWIKTALVKLNKVK